MTSAASRSISIVAIAARTPVGLEATESAASVRASVCRVGAHPFMLDARGEPLRMAFDPLLDPKLTGGRRLAALAACALDEIGGQLGAGTLASSEIFVALPESRPGFSDRQAEEMVADLEDGRGLEQTSVKVAGRGHAGVMQALSTAATRLTRGLCDQCVVVAADSYADADTIDWLEKNRQLAGEGVRGGFIPGEAAGAIAVANLVGRRTLRLPSLAEVRGVGTAIESRLIKTDTDVLGEGLHAAIEAATGELGASKAAIDDVYTDINGERYRADEWGFAVLRLAGALKQGGYHAPSSCWGDVGAASGALGCVLAVRAWRRGYAKGPRALVWAGSEGGLRGAVVLEAPGS